MTRALLEQAHAALDTCESMNGYYHDERAVSAAMVAITAALAQPEQSGKWVPMEPTSEMLDKGMHVNSEWLNDNAPIGERRYRDPARGVYLAMLAVAPTGDK